ncbi:hypothetical protein ACFL9T_10060 [Thermodesulfobacteriota bacterium]
MKTARIAIVASFVFFLIICPYAQAADSSDTKNWEFNLAPLYLWGVNLNGDVAIGPVTAPLNLKFGDIFSNLEAVFTAHFEAWYKQKWGFLLDFSYIDLGGQQAIPGATTLDVDFKNIMGELGVFYRFFDDGENAFEALFGVRYTDVDVSVDFVGLPPRLDVKQDWLDPMIGARYRWNMSDKWELKLRGDIGGFGIGDASDFTWNASALISWQPWKHVGLIGGYRVLSVDYKTGSRLDRFEYDVLMHGPIFGFNIVW